MRGRDGFLYQAERLADLPPVVKPKRLAGAVVGIEEDVALGDVVFGEGREAMVEEGAGDALAAVGAGDGEVVEVTAAAVVAAEDGADELVVVDGDGAESGVAGEEGGDGGVGVGLVEADAFGGLPEGVGGGVVGDLEFTNGHGWWVLPGWPGEW